MNIALTAFTARGKALALSLAEALEREGHRCRFACPVRLAAAGEEGYDSLRDWTGARFQDCRALVFVGAWGITVRAIAPWVRDKFTDPAVVGVDEVGRFAAALLSGHVGGANDLARRVAALTGGTACVTTATDVNGLFAIDSWAVARGLRITDRVLAKEISAALLEGGTVGWASDFPLEKPEALSAGAAELGAWVTARTGPGPFPRTLRLVPPCLTLGVGCRRGTGAETIAAAAAEILEDWDPAALRAVATIDLKQDEPGLLAFCRELGLPLLTYSAEELAAVPGEFSASEFVRSVAGVDNVCERAAVRAGGRLLRPKRAGNGVTMALAMDAVAFVAEQK